MKQSQRFIAAALATGLMAAGSALQAQQAPGKTTPDNTIITANLRQPMVKGKNVLWCATLQVAWDELEAKLGGPLNMVDAPPEVAVFNEHMVGKGDLDPGSYTVFVGKRTSKNRETLLDGINAKFGNGAHPSLLRAMQAKPGLFMYAYLKKQLPFLYPFDRSGLAFDFRGAPVASWNCFPGKSSGASGQINVASYKSDNDFVLTFRLRSPGDVLVLAKIEPGKTLLSTIGAVEKRLGHYGSLRELEAVLVPVLSMNLQHSYPQLCDHNLQLGRKILTDMYLSNVDQKIHFNLDEEGGHLESGVVGGVVGGVEGGVLGDAPEGYLPPRPPPREFLFNKPFLVMVQRATCRLPYLAIWVANPAFMFAPPEIREGDGANEPRTMNEMVLKMLAERGVGPEAPVYAMGSIEPPKLRHRVEPVVPAEALRKQERGKVEVAFVIDKTGAVRDAKVTQSSDPIFDQPALDAVRQWEYYPPQNQYYYAVSVRQKVTVTFNAE